MQTAEDEIILAVGEDFTLTADQTENRTARDENPRSTRPTVWWEIGPQLVQNLVPTLRML